ncbi:Hsp20/alpha crystallin family protein [Paracerasibacillus soli]|uniref:Hsp20/alpha crystallin family protein n=1 Tax=Paracerasibacillus soli TaxID=480284 RepID=A0ABU5CNS9_9BACI|nr:Hsp20/alpha crystallin family protein [Virgibacillus soli]MDY0408001.1 Hsp20/alpha crystallin family protein [Virgibacillus soli]
MGTCSEEKTDFIIEAELPGFSLKQIEIEIVESKVFIRAKNNTQELQQDIHNNHSLHKHAAERLEQVVTLPFIIPKKLLKPFS